MAFVSYTKFLTLFLILYNGAVFAQGPVVNTTLGQVRGVLADTGDYAMFLGIPFGKVREDNPFGEALPHPEYDGIFEANDDSAICPQEEEFNHTLTGTLDCLHLNVHVPNSASPTNLLPVLFYIYGGGFTLGFYGTFLYGPKFLVRHDIILVTVNYRLGPYGFMCLDIPEVPGNQGMKDQVMAMRWVQDNIANFGGDPNKVTIVGNSAGGMAVEYHLARKDHGPRLFHQAVLQSGTAYIPASFEYSKDIPFQLARHLGYETTDVYDALGFLSKVDPLAVIRSSLELGLAGGICAEKEFENVEEFINEDVTTITEMPIVKDMPIMLGFTNEEVYHVTLADINPAFEMMVYLFMSLVFGIRHPEFSFITDNIRTFYFGDDLLTNDQASNVLDFIGDIMFVYPTHQSMNRFLDNDVGKMYLYKFSYSGERNFVKHRENITGGGATHADELGYQFDISYMDEPNPEDQKVIDGMTAMWANFVKYADPTPETSGLLPHKWLPITKRSPYHYMDIDKELSVGTRPFQQRMTYLDLLYNTYYQKHITNVSGEVYQFLKKTKINL